MLRIIKPTNEALVKAIRAGGKEEERALSYLIEKNFGKAQRLVIKNGGSEADAEDVFQEALTALILNVRKQTFRGESSIHTYLYSICKGIWYKRFRKFSREKGHQGQMDLKEEDTQTPELMMIREQQKNLLLELFDRLREKCKEVLYQWASGYSMQEIAGQLEYGSAQVAMNKKNKCLKQLHQLIGNDAVIQQLLNEL